MIRFENYTIDAGYKVTTFVNHKLGVIKRFVGAEETGDFFDLMDQIETEWDAEEEPYSVVLDRLWEQTND
jgi:hypothetical protein